MYAFEIFRVCAAAHSISNKTLVTTLKCQVSALIRAEKEEESVRVAEIGHALVSMTLFRTERADAGYCLNTHHLNCTYSN